MRGAVACLLLLGLAHCSADPFLNLEEGSDFDGFEASDLTLGGISADDLGVLGLLQQFDPEDDAESTQQSFTVWPSTTFFLDSNLQSWVDQQMAVFDSLRGSLVSPCPHAAALATPPQSDYPSLLSYMASTRFGPATLTTYARQVDQDLQPAGFSISVSGDAADLDNVFAEPELLMGGWAVQDEQADNVLAEPADMQLEDAFSFHPRTLDVSSWFSQQQEAELQAGAEVEREPINPQQLFQAWDPNSMRAEPVEGPEDVPAWGDACNFILFVALCIGCVFVWIGLIRAWISCCRLEDQAKIRNEVAQQSGTNPLLAPLIPEGITKNPAYVGVEVAADQTPHGTFMAPRGAEFTTIAYMPLPSEMGMQK